MKIQHDPLLASFQFREMCAQLAVALSLDSDESTSSARDLIITKVNKINHVFDYLFLNFCQSPQSEQILCNSDARSAGSAHKFLRIIIYGGVKVVQEKFGNHFEVDIKDDKV